MQNKLTIELVPETSWYNNVRSNVSKEEWDYIRKKCYKKANYKCEICGQTGKSQGFKHPVECHEIWDYNDDLKIQKLTGLIALCPHCHKVKHSGLALMQGETEIVINQLMEVNKMNPTEALEYLNKAFALWEYRNNFDWDLDITYLDKYLDKPEPLF